MAQRSLGCSKPELSGYPLARATVRQRKTGRPACFELAEQTRQAVDDYLKATGIASTNALNC